MPIISSWFLWRRSSILTSTKFCDLQISIGPDLLLTHSWIKGDLLFVFFFIRQQTQDRSILSTCHTIPNEPQGGGKEARMRWGFDHCSWLLYQLAVTVRGSSLLPHQWLLYFPTCQVNIWKQALALEADCRSHSGDYRHKNTEMLLCGEATPVGYNAAAQR